MKLETIEVLSLIFVALSAFEFVLCFDPETQLADLAIGRRLSRTAVEDARERRFAYLIDLFGRFAARRMSWVCPVCAGRGMLPVSRHEGAPPWFGGFRQCPHCSGSGVIVPKPVSK